MYDKVSVKSVWMGGETSFNRCVVIVTVRDGFRQLVVDSSLCVQKNDFSSQELDPWLLVSYLLCDCALLCL